MIRDRLTKLRGKMAEKGIDFYMVPTSDFHGSEYVDDFFKVREYFSGFTGSNGTLVVGCDMAGLWTDGRYFIQAEKELEGTGITLFRMLEEGVPDIPDFLKQNMKKGQTLGFDGRTVSCRDGKYLEKKLEGLDIRFSYEEDVAGELWQERPSLPKHEVMILPEEISGQSMEVKLSAVRNRIKAAGANYLMLSKLDDLMWLMNIRGSDVACNPVALSYGFITPEELYFFIQLEEVTDDFREYAVRNHIVIKDYKEVAEFLDGYDYEGKVLIDEGNINYALYKVLSERADCARASNPTEALKAIKNKTELSRMEEVYLEDSAVLIKFIYWLKKNVGKEKITEISAAEYLDRLRRKIDGFIDLSFPTISAYKENAAMMHYEALPESTKEIKAEGMLLVDSGGQYLGGTTDVTRTIVLGEISPEEKKHFTKVAVGMLQLSDARFLYGCTGRNLDILARQPLWDIGIDYKCGTGHGIGYILNVHEGPQSIRWRFAPGMKEAVIEEGMVISNEPGVYIEGSHGIRTENVIVANKGEKNANGQFMYFDTLTFVPIDMEAIDTAYMQPIDVERLNRYHAEVYRRTEKYLTEEERAWLKEATEPIEIQR
ncbi:MAG: aminopeptidase P family protein [Clostridiales bacterium]|nr:aminopeptidase P family protein [Clostridiales bacterium]